MSICPQSQVVETVLASYLPRSCEQTCDLAGISSRFRLRKHPGMPLVFRFSYNVLSPMARY